MKVSPTWSGSAPWPGHLFKMMQIMDMAMTFIERIGFAPFVAVYLMVSYGRKFDRQIEEQRRSNVVLAVLVRILDDDGEVTEAVEEEE